MNGEKRVTPVYSITNLAKTRQADAVINRISDVPATTSQRDNSQTNCPGIHGFNTATGGRSQCPYHWS